MAHHGADDSIGRVFGLQRLAIRRSRMAAWNGLVYQRQLDDVVRAGLRAEVATREAAIELGASALGDGAGRVDDALGFEVATDDPGPIRRLVDGSLDTLLDTTHSFDQTLVDGLDGGLDRFERALRSVLLALNRRVSALLDEHEALEARLREYVGRLDDDDRAEQVAEFRRQLSTIQADLRTVQNRVQGYDPAARDRDGFDETEQSHH